MQKAAPPIDYFFEAPAPAIGTDAKVVGDIRRTFSGVAYSGAAVSDGWQPIVIDLASLVLPTPCPTLLQHDRDKRVGVCTLAVADGALTCDGYLLANEEAQELAADADGGFPFQLSVHAQPGTTEEVAPGALVNVNGRTLTGPLVIFRQTAIRELSFTPTGVDGGTSARVWSATPAPITPTSEAVPMTPEDLTAQVAQLTLRAETAEAEALAATTRAEAAETALATQARAVRLAAVQGVFAQIGRPISEADSGAYLALTDDAWSRVSADLIAAKPKPNPGLFSEQATGEPDTTPPAKALNLSTIYSARREVTQ